MDDLLPEVGVPAMVDGVQIALFRLADDQVLAVQQRDPYSGANVLSRGIVGSRADVATITSPMYKQVWNLATGECLDPVGKDPVDLRTCAVEVAGTQVRVSLGVPLCEVRPRRAYDRTYDERHEHPTHPRHRSPRIPGPLGHPHDARADARR